MTNLSRRLIFFDISGYQRQSTPLVLIRATRVWLQVGVFGFAVLCIVVGAVESLFGK